MNFDDRLRSALAHDPPPAVPPGFVNGIIAALPLERRARPDRLWPVRLAVAILIVMAVGVWLMGPLGSLSGPPASATVGSPTSPYAARTPSSSTTPGLTAWTHLSWRDVSPDFVGGSGPIVAGTSWSGGYVLVGETGPLGADGAIWYSADGTAWQRGVDSHGGTFEGMRFVGVAASGGTLVAVARFDVPLTPRPEFGVWYSTDGAVWSPSPDPQAVLSDSSIVGIAADPDGFVIYGTTQFFQQPTQPAMLFSSNGATWVQEAVPAVHGEAVTSVVATADGFAAVGGPAPGVVRTGVTGAAWWSPDGQTWHSGTVDSGHSLYGVVRWVGGELRAWSSTQTCCVSSGMPETTTWSSADGGRSWRSIGDGLAFPVGDTTMYDAGRLVRLQTEGSPWATWSSDGVTWVPLRMDGTSPTNASPCHVSPCSTWYLILADGSALVATGSQPDGRGGSRTEVLVGQLDDQPGPAPTPTLVPGSQDTPCKGTNPCGP